MLTQRENGAVDGYSTHGATQKGSKEDAVKGDIIHGSTSGGLQRRDKAEGGSTCVAG